MATIVVKMSDGREVVCRDLSIGEYKRMSKMSPDEQMQYWLDNVVETDIDHWSSTDIVPAIKAWAGAAPGGVDPLPQTSSTSG